MISYFQRLFSLITTCLLLQAHAVKSNESDNRKLQTAFQKDCASLLLRTIREAKQEILVAVYSFSYDKIADALIEQKKRGCDIKIKMDKRQARKEWSKPIVKKLKKASISTTYISMPKKQHMHNKFIVVDGVTVITGSYNFTYTATKNNWENLIRIDDKAIAADYIEQWHKIKSKNRRSKKYGTNRKNLRYQ